MFGIPRLYLVIGALILLWLGSLVFGKSPLEEARKRRAIKNNKTLVEKIVQNAKKKDKANGLLGDKKKTPNGLRYGMDTSADVQPMEAAPPEATLSASTRSRATNTRRPNNAAMGTPNPVGAPAAKPSIPAASEGATSSSPATAAPPADIYYPPPAPNLPGNGKRAAIDRDELFKPTGLRLERQVKARGENGKEYTTKSIAVTFSGVKAFAVDEAGNTTPLKDGFYQLPGSQHKILIQGGEKVISN